MLACRGGAAVHKDFRAFHAAQALEHVNLLGKAR
jgi:hypothetical protein